MIGDPNWLYSTIAQSSAAIVAIVGGFITATVLMLTSEKRSLKNQLADKKSQLKAREVYRDQVVLGENMEEWEERVRPRTEDISLKFEITNLETRLRTFSYPQNLGWGVAVLGYLAVFGILLPVLVIWKEAYFYAAKTLTMASFYIGIIGIFAYIVFQIRELRRK